ncbi:hypothetical protein TK90_2752 (plasmid) [Thioalkalivibrio sp. K90mix]|uniref:hypothetical protein n=1 Tax=Thioalkalivibrio sp. (strain K90mix) TaxID=396595 RepID=UPI000195A5EC|nr:hypothetical protein [Thioalkalivibrio sp. K90mix]ADC73237.1 hypothetical protein TK90_2752 [Thioalkalivibrio sp. K90mix]
MADQPIPKPRDGRMMIGAALLAGGLYAICDGATLAAILDSLGDNWTEERLQEITEEMAAGLLEAGYKAA